MCHILTEIKIRKIFPVVYFVNTNLLEKIVQVLLSETELSELPEDSRNIFKKPKIDHFMERPTTTFFNGKYSILDDFCCTEFFADNRLEN